MIENTWEFRIQLWRARLGWHWWVQATLNGRDDPTVPEGYPWAPTFKTAVRRAAREATDRALQVDSDLIEIPLP